MALKLVNFFDYDDKSYWIEYLGFNNNQNHMYVYARYPASLTLHLTTGLNASDEEVSQAFHQYL